jgi:HlyD family secretion protein
MTPSPLRILLAAAVACAPLAVAAQHAATPASAEAPAIALPAISVVEVRRASLRDRIMASGLVDAVEEVQVQPLVEGQPIDALLADVGDRVEAGQVLARLSTATLELQLSQLAANRASVQAQIAQAEASLAQATANADEAERVAARNARLAEDGTVPRAQADQSEAAALSARAAVDVARQGVEAARAQRELVEAQIANAELQLSRAEVKAPVAGLVVARNAQVGAIASGAGPALFTIVRDGAMELRAELAEQDLLRVRPGQRVTMTGIGWPAPVEGTVRLVEPAIDRQSRLGFARIDIPAGAEAVKGMFLTAEILVAEEEQLAVPVTAIGSEPGGGASVMRVGADGVVERVAVRTGIRDGATIGILEGLAEGDRVVAKAGAFVRDGDRVNPVDAGQGE